MKFQLDKEKTRSTKSSPGSRFVANGNQSERREQARVGARRGGEGGVIFSSLAQLRQLILRAWNRLVRKLMAIFYSFFFNMTDSQSARARKVLSLSLLSVAFAHG